MPGFAVDLDRVFGSSCFLAPPPFSLQSFLRCSFDPHTQQRLLRSSMLSQLWDQGQERPALHPESDLNHLHGVSAKLVPLPLPLFWPVASLLGRLPPSVFSHLHDLQLQGRRSRSGNCRGAHQHQRLSFRQALTEVPDRSGFGQFVNSKSRSTLCQSESCLTVFSSNLLNRSLQSSKK